MELKQYLNLLRQWWWLLILMTLIGGAAGFVGGRLKGPTYEASTTILIYQAPGTLPGAEQVSQGQRVADTYAQLLQQRPVMEEVIQNLGLAMDAEALQGKVRVSPVRDTNLLELGVTDGDPQRAADIANEIARVFIEQNVAAQSARYAESLKTLQTEIDTIQADITSAEADLAALTTSDATLTPQQTQERNRLQALVADYRNSYAILLDRYEQVRLAQAQATDRVSVVEEALPGQPVSSSTTVIVLEGSLAGLILSIGVVLLIEYLSDAVKTKEEVEQITGVRMLGMVGIIPATNEPADKLVTMHNPNSADAEAYQLLSTNVEHAATQEGIRALVVTSSTPLEGKTTTAANLAISLAQGGWQVILVDMDLRRPALHRIFQQPNRAGVSAALQQPGGSVMDHLVPAAENLYLMTSGPLTADASAVLHLPRLVELIEELKTHADIVILDTPPVMVVADPILVARLADAILLVVHAGVTKASVLRQAVEIVTSSGAKLLGFVLNQVKSHRDGSYYYYDYNYYETPTKK